ncbi:MAG: hypothetical protein ACKOAU_13025 [Pirellula sp.]
MTRWKITRGARIHQKVKTKRTTSALAIELNSNRSVLGSKVAFLSLAIATIGAYLRAITAFRLCCQKGFRIRFALATPWLNSNIELRRPWAFNRSSRWVLAKESGSKTAARNTTDDLLGRHRDDQNDFHPRCKHADEIS